MLEKRVKLKNNELKGVKVNVKCEWDARDASSVPVATKGCCHDDVMLIFVVGVYPLSRVPVTTLC